MKEKEKEKVDLLLELASKDSNPVESKSFEINHS